MLPAAEPQTIPPLARRLSGTVPVMVDRPKPRSVPTWYVAALGGGIGASLAAAALLPWLVVPAVVLIVVFLAGLFAAVDHTKSIIAARRIERERAQAGGRRIAQLLETSRALIAQSSEIGVYEQLRKHAARLVRNDGFELALFNEKREFAGRFSDAGLIDGFNADPREQELQVVEYSIMLLDDGEERRAFDVATASTGMRIDRVREVFVALHSRATVVGVMALRRETPGFSLEELDLIAALAQQGGYAVGQARLFSQIVAAKREWQGVFESVHEGVLLVDAHGVVRRINGAMAELVAISPVGALGSDHHRLGALAPEQPEGCAVCATIEGGKRAERVIQTADGRVLKLSFSPYSGGGAVVIAQDVTAETNVRAAEQRLFHSEKFAAIGRLAAGVSHEVNNPLMGISGLAYLLLEDKALSFDADTRGMLEMILRESKRAAQITKDLLSFVRADEGTREQVNLNELIEEVVRIRGVAHESRGITTVLDLSPGLPVLHAVRGQLVQVLVNVITNAEDAVEERDRREIRISTSLSGGRCILRVEDSGPGIPDEHRPRLFEPFFTTKAPGKGTGLGLPLAFTIVERHGGVLSAENVPGSGARFTIELPVAPSATAAVAA